MSGYHNYGQAVRKLYATGTPQGKGGEGVRQDDDKTARLMLGRLAAQCRHHHKMKLAIFARPDATETDRMIALYEWLAWQQAWRHCKAIYYGYE